MTLDDQQERDMSARTKIALTAALVLGSASGAFAYNNVGEIGTPAVHSQMSKAFASFASQRQTPAMQKAWFERNVRDY